MRRRPALLLACAVIALLASASGADAASRHAKGDGILHVTLTGGPATVAKAHGSVYVTLPDVHGLKLTTFKGRRTTGHRAIGIAALRRTWNAGMGPRPIVELSGRGGRTTLYNLTGRPTWNASDRSLTFAADATTTNRRAAAKAATLGRRTTVRILPTRAALPPGRRLPTTRQSYSSTSCSTIQPARANTSFCLPYQTGLGTGGSTWVNILSGTMQTTPSCQVTPNLQPVGGNTAVVGTINVYQDAASAQAALSISAQLKYSQGLVSAEANASFSKSSSTSTNAVYAIAQVNLVSGTVNFGKPALNTTATDQAAAVDDGTSALRFLQTCGDSVPVSYSVGASWMAVLQLNTASQSAAESLSTSLSGSFAGVGAGVSFSSSVESSSYTESIVESDYCAGPPSCTSVTGYVDPASAGGDVNAAMNIFTNNYSLMLTNLANLCNPGPSLSSCITQMQYQPIYTLLPGTGGTTSPSSLVSNAATAAYAVQSNFNAWATGYQALMTGAPNSWAYPDWQLALGDLQDGGPTCDINGLASDTCSNQFQWCWNEISYSLSSQSPDCLPSAFYIDNLYGLANPASISAS
jgi:hypothetical protein